MRKTAKISLVNLKSPWRTERNLFLVEVGFARTENRASKPPLLSSAIIPLVLTRPRSAFLLPDKAYPHAPRADVSPEHQSFCARCG